MRAWIALPLLAMLAPGQFGAAVAAGPQVAGRSAGATLYRQYGCYACHGYSGAGSTSTGLALAGRGLTTARVIAYARHPGGVMPPYRLAVLRDADLEQIARYVVSLPGAKPVAQIPGLARFDRSPPIAKQR